MKRIAGVFFLFSILSFQGSAFSGRPIWPAGEEFTYKVRWSIFRLGTLRLKVDDTLRIDDNLIYHVEFFLDSNPLLFFVNHHSVFESYFDASFDTRLFRFNEKIDGVPYDAEYRFDYSDSLIFVELTDGRDSTQQIHRRIPFDEKVFDGTALLYYLRFHSGETKVDTVFYLSDDSIGKAVVRLNGRRYPLFVGPLNRNLSSHYLDGRVLRKSVAGLAGYFQAWISADRQRVPLKAKLKVFIGYVTVELEKWNLWQPLE